MQGRNHLILNQETMIEAIQFWLDEELRVGGTTVVAVEQTMDAGATMFRVTTESVEDEEAE